MQIEMIPIESIREYERNPRQIGEDAVAAVSESIKSFGFRNPVLLDANNVLVAGHTRVRAARKLGLKEVPALRITDLTPEQLRALRVSDNKTAELAEWDLELLPIELAELQEAGIDWSLLGFDPDELLKLLHPELKEGLTDPDAVPEPPDDPITRPGDLWILGEHRLLCGDSSSVADVDRLLDGAKIHLVNTDPPYNVKCEPRSNNAIAAGLSSFGEPGVTHHQGFDYARRPEVAHATHCKLRPKDRPLVNDFVSDEEFDRLLHAWFGNIARVLEPGRGFYIWGGYANCANYPPVLKACGLYFSQAIIWDKQHPVLTRKDFMGAHEWCQPPGTQVLTPSGYVAIESLRDWDRVLSYDRRSSVIIGLRHGLGIRTTSREYTGQLYGVTAGGALTWCTDGHLWTVRLIPEASSYWCVYLMRRGPWWRVGKCRLISRWYGFGLKARLRAEQGEAAWILSIHDSDVTATLAEQAISVRYGIPTTHWTEYKNSKRTRVHIEGLYAELNLAEIERAARRALRAHHRCLEWPMVTLATSGAKQGRSAPFVVRACNLLPKVMAIPVPVHKHRFTWTTISHVDRQPYMGPVHSLEVDEHHHYIADGLVTHNCFYGWKEGAAHLFLGPNNIPDLWHVKKINPQQMEHLTAKPAELGVRAMQYSSRPGENVLDLFGGSGSTLIAAEQAGRKAFLMEIDPLYCDVICDRFQRFSGTPAVLERTGTSPIPMKPREENMR